MALTVGDIVAKIRADTTEFNRGISEARNGAEVLGTRIQSVAGVIEKFTLIAGAAGVAAAGFLGKTAIDEAKKYEQQVIALTTLLGDNAKAQAHIRKIQQDALRTPFNVEGLITANQLLISAGINADQAETDVLNLGDAISANGKGAVELDRIIVNMQQIKNVGKATEMDMKQFAFNGINMYQLLADSTKLPIEKLKDMDITYEMISKALAKASGEGGKYHDANVRQSQSLQGLISNLQDTASQTLIQVANQSGLFEATKQVVAVLTQLIVNVGPPLIAFLIDFSAKVVEVTKFLIEHKGEVETVAKILAVVFGPAIAGVALQMGINFVTSIASATANIIMFAFEGWKMIAMLTVKTFQLGLATAAFLIHTAVTIAHTTATVAVTAATWLLNAALAVLTSPIFLVVLAIGALIAIGYLLIKNWDSIKKFGSEMLEGLKLQWNGFVGFLKGIGQSILDGIMWPFTEAKKKIDDTVNWIKDKLDFTKRHSPSVVDVVKSGVKQVNRALDDLMISPSINSEMAVNSLGNSSSKGLGVANINIDLNGAVIGSRQTAIEMAEILGDQIIRKLEKNVRF